MAAGSPLAFYFDFVSPYAYIAWTQIHSIAARGGRTVEAIPVLFAGLLDAHGTKGPAEIPAKRAYTFRDAYRKAHRLGLPALCPPPSHPFNPLVALRVASLPRAPEEQRRLIDALYDASWVSGRGVETEETVAAAASAAGFDGAALVDEARHAESKQRLRDATSRAVASGVFGVPSVVVDGEVFWGVDGLDYLETFLRGEDPVPNDLAWAERPATAVRRVLRTP